MFCRVDQRGGRSRFSSKAAGVQMRCKNQRCEQMTYRPGWAGLQPPLSAANSGRNQAPETFRDNSQPVRVGAPQRCVCLTFWLVSVETDTLSETLFLIFNSSTVLPGLGGGGHLRYLAVVYGPADASACDPFRIVSTAGGWPGCRD